MRGTAIVTAAAETHPGFHRAVNEDRVHADPVRGIFAVIDGVGGHAAGEKAADTALAMLRARLERETGAIEDRVREAIAVAATEIHRQAALRPEWHGMTCVLTVAVLDEDGSMVIGHVGDTRLYKIRRGKLVKLTRDHSPVGEREDAGELSESAAMSHPRRNEVYRDVGSEPRNANDADFIDVIRAPFEPDAAILLCSDGLTDYVPADVILRTIEAHRGNPQQAALALIDAANAAGGKDNISVVYAEGAAVRGVARHERPDPRPIAEPPAARPWLVWALLLASWAAVAMAAWAYWDRLPVIPMPGPTQPGGPIQVREGGSITAALASATPGSIVIVAPGEYRERITLRPGVEVRSASPRAAVLRLPTGASESDPAVLGADVTGAAFNDFRIVGDAATPLGIGILLQNSEVSISNVEISGASRAAIEFGAATKGRLLAAHLHDNAGAALIIREGARPQITASTFERNGRSDRSLGAFFVAPGASPQFLQNVFVGVGPAAVVPVGSAVDAIQRDNIFQNQAPVTPQRTPRRRP
jgi:PPM family protein phosphatase